jgi:hypothetical protein
VEHIRAVVNQIGIAMELHEHAEKPIMLDLIGYHELGMYRDELAKSNPGMIHATIGQLAVMYANRIFQNVRIDPSPWTYNASSDTYERGN